jgi:hypothetical protein
MLKQVDLKPNMAWASGLAYPTRSVGRLFNITKNNLILHHFIIANYVILRNFPQNLQIYGFHSGTVDKKK